MAIADAPRSAEASPVFTRPDASSSGESRADEGFWIAVLPFKHAGGDADLAALAEGLSEEIVTGLSRFSYLRVIANNATSRSARYVMEGSLRRAGSALRVATQLVDTGTGAHLWAETYDRTFVPDAIFALQDELVPRMVSTVADMHGVLPRSMSEAVRSKPAEALSPYEAVLRSFGYFERITPEELAAARAGLESAVKKAPAYADAWAMLALLCVQEYAQGFELKADALATGLAAARRAVEAAPSSHLAHFGLAQALFFQKDVQSFRNAAERAVALNPMDGNTIAFAGEMLTYAGDRDRGLALAARAKQLNPHHPGWYWYANFYDAYRRGDDRAALDFALKVNLPGHWAVHVMIACASAQLGDRDTAEKAVKEAGRLKPNFGASARPGLEKWFDREYVERVLDGLRKAGVNVGI
jgi:adenylate cyclase